jgi:outer membrane lipoprotein-sorting protein
MESALLLAALAALPADPRAALAAVDSRAAALESVRYAAVRTTIQGQVRQEERWAYAAEPGGRFRLDYVGDTPRSLACDGAVMWDYVPALGAAQRVDLNALSDEKRAEILGNVLSRVAIPNVRTGIDAARMDAWTWGEDGMAEGRATRTVVVTDARGGELRFTLDAEEGYLVASRIEENGVFVASTEGTGWREVAPDVWVPGRVVSTAPAPGGKVRVELDLLQVVVGQDLPDHLFHLTLDPSVQVRDVPGSSP